MQSYVSRVNKALFRLVTAVIAISGLVMIAWAGSTYACSSTSTVNGITLNNFICPGGSEPYNGNSYDNPATPDISISSPQGGDGLLPTQIDAGSSVTITLTYRPGITRNNVWAWIQTPVSLSNIEGIPISHSQNGNPGTYRGTEYPVNGGTSTRLGCPSFWVGLNSPYQNQANAQANGSDLGRYQLLDHAELGHTGCGADPVSYGTAAIWENAGGAAGSTYRYTATFRVQPDANPDATMCFSGRVSADGGAQTNPIANLKARVGANGGLCFKIGRATIKGTVKSDAGNSTGKRLGNVSIRYNRAGNCAGPWSFATTNSNGEYSFEIAQGSPFCIQAKNPAELSGGSTVINGTTYINPNPANHYDSSGCHSDECAGYSFIYQPSPTNPGVAKSIISVTGPGGGAKPVNGALAPGDIVRYRVTTVNPYDYNMPNVAITDYIPNNIDPTSATGPSNFSTSRYDPYGGSPGSPGVPGTWDVEGAPFCNTFSSYRYDGSSIPNGGSWANFFNFVSCFADVRVKRVGFFRFPAYTQFSFEWQGQVKAATGIGIYPHYADDAHADHPNCSFSAPNTNGGLVGCQDKTIGYQGVYNIAWAQVNGSPSHAFSAATYNPIPGGLSITKSISTEQGVNVDPSEDSYEEYDPNDSEYDNGRYTIAVAPEVSMGPIEYQVIDANDGTQNFTAAQLHAIIRPALPNCQPSATATLECGNTVRWNFLHWPFNATPGNFMFDVKFNDVGQALGSTFDNVAKACWVKYWEPARGTQCLASNPARAERADVDRPYFAARKGGIKAGGGIASATPGICQTPDHGDIRTNSGTYGEYVVSAYGDVAPATSRISITSQGGQQCRPNILKAVNDYYERGVAYRIFPGPTSITTSTNDDSHYNKVVRAPSGSDVTISGLQVKKRWTLHAQRDLYITGDITSNPGTHLISGQPSLGIVVEGNVYISKDVANIDALIFAKGSINTCAKGPGQTLENPVTPSGYSVANCKEKNLKVNGVLMGKKIQFTRTREVTGPNSEAELAELVGRTYILPPPGFSSLFSTGGSTIVQDRRPRF